MAGTLETYDDSWGLHGMVYRPGHPKYVAPLGEVKALNLPPEVSCLCPKCGAKIPDSALLPLHQKKKCKAR